MALLLVGPAVGPTAGAILEVADCGDTLPGGAIGQLRRAITDAAPHDVILLPACTIVLGGAALEDLNVEGDLDVASGKRLLIQGAGPGRTILDGAGRDRVLQVLPDARVSLRGLTIRNGVTATGGGGLAASSNTEVELVDVVVEGNRAEGPGGGVLSEGVLRMVRTTLAGNEARVGGGANTGGGARVLVERSTISGNRATGHRGGGVASDSEGILRMDQSTLSGNEALAGRGGGLSVVGFEGRVTLLHVTVAGNRADLGGGVFHANPATLDLQATLLSGNAPESCAGDGIADSAGHNLQDDTTCAFAVVGDQSGVDPRLGSLGDHGGPTATHGLRAGSPALDQGGEAGCPVRDQRGVARPQAGTVGAPVGCDVGAVERRAPSGARAVIVPAARPAPDAP